MSEPLDNGKVLVVGAHGVLGHFIAEELSQTGREVIRAGRPQLDLADPDAVSRACRDADLVISTAHHPDLNLEKTVLRQGGTLIDLIELSGTERARLDAEAADAGGLVVVHTGLGGVAYLAIADMLRNNAGADASEYALMLSAAGSSGRAGGRFAHQLLTGASHHASATVPFPEPFGTRRCLEVGGDFGGPLRAEVGGAPVRHLLCMQPRALNGLMRGLNAARAIATLPSLMFTAGARRVPDELSAERICEWVAVSRGGARVASRAIEGRGYYRMTVAATLVFAEALSQIAHRPTGVRSIEEVLVLPELLEALERAGVSVRG
jgi:hypothetical protein